MKYFRCIGLIPVSFCFLNAAIRKLTACMWLIIFLSDNELFSIKHRATRVFSYVGKVEIEEERILGHNSVTLGSHEMRPVKPLFSVFLILTFISYALGETIKSELVLHNAYN